MSGRRGFSLMEVTIVIAILSIVIFMAITSLIISQRQVDVASTEQLAQSRTRLVAHAIADDLRDAALVSLDPPSFTNATELRYQLGVGFNPDTFRPVPLTVSGAGSPREGGPLRGTVGAHSQGGLKRIGLFYAKI